MRSTGVIIAALLWAGCTAAVDTGPPSEGESEAIRKRTGVDTSAHPEIGVLFHVPEDEDESGGVCTATAVARHVVLTAAHCVADKGDAHPAGELWFTLPDDRGLVGAEELVGYPAAQSFVMGPASLLQPADDVALVRLRHTLPTDLPLAPLGATEPQRGERVAAFGYGHDGWGFACRWGSREIMQKRVAETGWPVFLLEAYGCPGDSGGPIMNEKGEVVALTSGGNPFGTYTRVADVVGNHKTLRSKVNEWKKQAAKRRRER